MCSQFKFRTLVALCLFLLAGCGQASQAPGRAPATPAASQNEPAANRERHQLLTCRLDITEFREVSAREKVTNWRPVVLRAMAAAEEWVNAAADAADRLRSNQPIQEWERMEVSRQAVAESASQVAGTPGERPLLNLLAGMQMAEVYLCQGFADSLEGGSPLRALNIFSKQLESMKGDVDKIAALFER